MTREELLEGLQRIIDSQDWDKEVSHIEADGLLMEFINDDAVYNLYNKIEKWYA